MNYTMMEASNSTSASIQTVTFREYLRPAEPMSETTYRSPVPVLSEETSSETVVDDHLRLGDVRRNTEINMDQLQVNFQNILHLQVKGVTVGATVTEPSSTTETESSSFGLSVEENFAGYRGLSAKECQDLKSIALRMNSKGRLGKLISVYVKERKSFMNVHFQKLWDEKLSSYDIQSFDYEVMEKKSMRWIRAAECSLRSIFPYEKQLSIQIFKDLGNATDESCFYSTVMDCATQLFRFLEAVCSCRQSPERRLQIILLLYGKFSDLMPQINSVFDSGNGKSIRDHATYLLCEFEGAVKSTLSDFEGAVLHELSKDPIPGGTIHNLTKYVMGYTTSVIAKNGEMLMDLITSRPSSLAPLDCSDLRRGTPVAAHVLWIITALQLNLEGKSKSYQDKSLSHLFMMNNVHYISQQIGQSVALREMIGNDHLRKLTENVEKSLAIYLSTTWDDLVYCLRNEGLHVSWGFTSSVSKGVLKERLKKFNAMFQKILQTHGIWAVPDPELRSKVHRSILDKLIPSYRNFISHVERGSCSGKHVIYPAEDLQAKILSLFGYREFL